MKWILKFFGLPALSFQLLPLSSFATTPQPSVFVPASVLPAEVTINKDAGHGNWLFINLSMESGEELPFFIDTGASGSCFDKKLEPQLGKRLGHFTIRTLDDGQQESFAHAEPKLYSGDTLLMTGSNIGTYDFKRLSVRAGRPIMGVLGMDCLGHYCIQLDFGARKMKFLEPGQIDTATLGKSYPLLLKGHRPFIRQVGLTGGSETNLLIDTGCVSDGYVEKTTVDGNGSGLVKVPECIWDGNTYTNLLVGRGDHIIGLKFLARHLVTLDFPSQTMYLKPIEALPPGK